MWRFLWFTFDFITFLANWLFYTKSSLSCHKRASIVRRSSEDRMSNAFSTWYIDYRKNNSIRCQKTLKQSLFQRLKSTRRRLAIQIRRQSNMVQRQWRKYEFVVAWYHQHIPIDSCLIWWIHPIQKWIRVFQGSHQRASREDQAKGRWAKTKRGRSWTTAQRSRRERGRAKETRGRTTKARGAEEKRGRRSRTKETGRNSQAKRGGREKAQSSRLSENKAIGDLLQEETRERDPERRTQSQTNHWNYWRTTEQNH